MLIRTPADLGAAIRDHRRRRGMDQQELASAIGVSRQWVIEMEKGKPRASLALALRALDALGIALSIAPTTGADSAGSGGLDIDQIVEDAREQDS